jgi:hypothetical protein
MSDSVEKRFEAGDDDDDLHMKYGIINELRNYTAYMSQK